MTAIFPNRREAIQPGSNFGVNNIRILAGILSLLFIMTGCGGTKVLNEPEPLVVVKPLATASDENISVSLDWVIFRDGPGTWAKNVDWDEYLFRVEHVGQKSLQITNIEVLDSLGTMVGPDNNRSDLVKATKDTKKRYKGYGLDVKAGVSSGALLAAGAVTAVTVASAGGAIMYGGTALAAGVGTGVLLVPVLAVGGVMRGVNNSKVNNEIKARQTGFPVTLRASDKQALDIFFPLAPSPQQVVVTYINAAGEHKLFLHTQDALNGLHLTGPEVKE